ncbi:protease modulator HflC, partial [Erwinia amylovora]|nr:protease modulator HflC [Erwinia amylovora]
AEARRHSLITQGEVEPQAAKQLAYPISKHPDFNPFLRTQRAYDNSIKSNHEVKVLSPDIDIFRFRKTPATTTR